MATLRIPRTPRVSDSLRDELRQYLLRTAGTELANAALSCASGTENAGQLKEKVRL